MRFQNMITGEWKETTEWQENLKVGDYYCIESYGIYGQILEESDDLGFFWVKAYSSGCPMGETGGFCVVDADRQLTQAEFEQAKQNGWR